MKKSLAPAFVFLLLLAARSFGACNATMEIVSVLGSSSAGVNNFPDGSQCSDGPNEFHAAGISSAGCAMFAGQADSTSALVAGAMSFTIIGSGSASVDPAGNNRLAEAGASVLAVVRAVGGDLRIRITEEWVSTQRRPDNSAVDTITFGPLTREVILLDGEEREIGTSFRCSAVVNVSGGGTFATVGSCFLEATAEPIPKTTFTWNNPAGGAYADPANWLPNCGFPESTIDTAAFGLESPPNIAFTGSGVQAGRWTIFRNTWTFTGSAEVLSTSPVFPSLAVQNGGSLFLDGSLRSQHTVIDGGTFGESELQVLGNGNWENVGHARIGRGRLRVFSAASTGDLIVGTNQGPAQVESTLDGMLAVNRLLTVGATHPGRIEITDGGAVQVTQPGLELAVIGENAEGSVSVHRNGRLLVERTLVIGNRHNGLLEIGDGGYTRAGTLRVNGSAGDGRLVVGGATDTAVLDVNNTLFVSAVAPTEVLITNRAVVSTPELIIGMDQVQPGTAEMTIRGPNAHLNVEDTFPGAGQAVQPTQIGIDAPGVLTVAGGAQADLNGGLVLGSVSQGTMAVSSLNAPSQTRVRVKSFAEVGSDGRGILQVGDDALLTVDGDLFVGMGAESPSGTVSISPQSFLTVNGTLQVGGNGKGHLTADVGSFVTVNGPARVGGNAPGVFDVRNSSVARCDTLEVGGFTAEAPGTIVVGTVSELRIVGNAQVGMGLGRGEIYLDLPTAVLELEGNMDVGNPAGGPGGGALILEGATVNGSETSLLTINKNGALTGTGTINLCGSCRIPAGGVISPGLSPGLLAINGNLDLLSSGVLIIEVAGLAPGQMDVIEVSGDVTLGGTVEVRFLDGFLPRQGDTIEFLGIGGALSNNFEQIVLPQAAPGFDAELNLSPGGKLQLIARNDAQAGSGATIVSPVIHITPALRFNHFSLDAGQLTLSWTTTPGRSYRIEGKNSLNETNWTTLTTNIPAGGTSLSMTFSISEAPHRFYRVAETESP